MKNKESLRAKIEEITNLPTLPEIATKLMNIINDPTTSSRDVAKILSRDPSLSAKVLRLANSAFYGIPRTITTINNAVVILGLKVINTIVLSLTVFEIFPQDKGKMLFNRTEFWKHSISCALLGKIITKQLRKNVLFDPEEIFCAGLLHDIGKVVMEQYLHEDLKNALLHAKKNKIPMVEAEKDILGYDHAEVGKWLTSKWDLPQELLAPIVFHHSPEESANNQEVVAIIHLADHLCYELCLNLITFNYCPKRNEKAISILKLTDKDFENIREEMKTEVNNVDLFLSIVK